MGRAAAPTFPMPGAASLWAETALPLDGAGPLIGDAEADVVIVGAGYTGLSAARRFAERGLRPIVIDASTVGWGASGRNGGVVSTKYRVSMPAVARSHGLETARRMYRIGHEAVDAVEETVETLAIEGADLQICGNLRCAHNGVALAALTAEAAVMRDSFGDTAIRILDATDTAAETGSRDFVGGVLTPHSGLIHPLNYARGMARALLARGVAVHGQTPALRLRPEGAGVVVETPTGRIRAPRVVLATNGYSDLTLATQGVRRTLIPFRSAMVASEPLLPAVRATLMRERRSYSETRRMMRWFRPHGDRMIFGGRGAFGKSDSGAAFAALERALRQLFPQLEGAAITHRWSGLVAMTLASVPHVGRLDERVSYALGYNGTGIAMATLMGRHVADVALGEAPDLALMNAPTLRTVPFYAVREPAVRVVAGWYQFLDAAGR
ncbi:FAD-binding oxidoreductase [Aureimonas sp. AU12]|uniref:NAD(P)/FAD-dependent oxidoreductase n=1 Tax=Aureimonas sp. AU12 TaxID=1638161 RepID=UPI00078308D5|nr:FAD-binding oxidoreductase [Aureimonas sp. AU12]